MKWLFAVRAVTFALLFACSGVGSPAADGGHPALANLDGRQAAVDPARPTPNQALAHARLRARLPQVRIAWEPVTGSPRFIHSRDGFLTGPDGQGLAVGPARAFEGDANHAPIKAFIGEHPGLFGHGPEVLEQSTLVREFVTDHNGLHTVVWQQEVEGIPVFGGLFIGHVTRNGELVSVSSGMLPEAATAARRGTPRQMAVGRESLLPARTALAIGAASLGATVTTNEAGNVAVPVKAATPSRFQTLTLDGVRGEAYGRRVWLPMDRVTLRLCWELILTPDNRTEMYRLLVDAETGDVLIRHSLTEEIDEATYHVFTSDSPTPFTPGHSVPSTTQPPVVSRMPVTLGALSTNASPAGWIPEGVNETRGNNVRAHTDHDNNNQPDLPRPGGSPFRVFNPPLDLEGDPRNSSDAAVVQLFYWCNWMHDRLYELGFTEGAGNFQESNFGRGGIGGDPVDADAQDGGGFNNANFGTPPEGLPPRMQMYLWNGPTPPRDASLDAEIILHEYTHGLSNRRVGGGVGITALQSRGLGEGWSDFYALALLSEPGDDPHAVYPSGGYSSHRLRGLTENYYFGIRRYPYSTDPSRNPLTFKDIDPDQISSHPGVPISPAAIGEADSVHRIGEVWCVMLWESRANLIDKYGFETGNELILQLVTDAMNLTPPNPTFVEARDAILLADLINHAGANYVDLWSAFAKRGLGAGSIASASDTTRGVQEAFDLPDDLLIVAPLGLTARGPVGGPFIPSSRTYALTNIGNENLTVDIARDAEWLSLSLSSTTLQPGGPARQTVASVNPLAATLPPGSHPATVTISNRTSGVSQSFAWLLEVRPRDYFTEAFPEGDNDVGFQTLTFLPDESASQYSVCRVEAAGFPTDPAGGVVAGLSDDNFVTVTLSGERTVAVYGTRTNRFHIGSNGYLSFGSPDAGKDPAFSRHFDRPRISGLFTDLNPLAGGQVTWKELEDRVAVTFLNIREFGTTNENSFQIECFYDGALRLTHLRLDTRHGLIGLSAGGGLAPGFLESDLTRYLSCPDAAGLDVPGKALEGSGVLAGQGVVTIPEAVSTNLTVQVASSRPLEAYARNPVSIPAGATQASFDIVVENDSLLNLDRPVVFSALTPGFATAHATLLIEDDETAVLALSLPDSVLEGQLVEGVLSVGAIPFADVIVPLIPSDPALIEVPSPVMIPAGQTSAVFSVEIPDNSSIDPPRAATLRAEHSNWTPAEATLSIIDDEERVIALQVPETAREGDGMLAGAGSVQIVGPMETSLLVVLFSTDTNDVVLPPFVTIPAGGTNAPFDITIVDDAVLDLSRSVELFAFANGFDNGTATILVEDNETANLTLAFADSATEGDPPLGASVSIDGAAIVDVRVGIESSDPAQLEVPSEVLIPAGETAGVFEVTLPEDDIIDGPRTYTVTARVPGWPEAARTLTVLDNEGTNLTLNLPAQVYESDGVLSGAGRVRLGGVLTSNLVIALESGDAGRLEVPGTVTVMAGQSSVSFDLTLVDNDQTEGLRTVSLTARAPGFNSALGALSIADDDVHHFVFGPVEDPQTAGMAFEVSITARDIEERLITRFEGEAALGARRGEMGLSVEPTNTTAFVEGVWSGPVTLITATNEVELVAGEEPGPVGVSERFEVEVGPLEHFEWGFIPTPQLAGVPFDIDVTARDGVGNTVGDFEGTVSLSARVDEAPAPVVFEPMELTGFVDGVWTGQLTVQEVVTNLALRAEGAGGQEGQANRIAVIQPDDLVLSLVGPPLPVTVSNQFSYSVVVTNPGPSEATGLWVTNTLDPGAPVVEAEISQGSLGELEDGVRVAALGSLAAGTHATLTFTVQGGLPGTLNYGAEVVRGEPDANAENHAGVLRVEVTNLPPQITLVSPGEGEVFLGPTNVTLEAEATDTEGIARVEFFADENLLGQVTEPPYSLVWSNAQPAVYALRATATDTLGALASTPAVSITVSNFTTNLPPVLVHLVPADQTLFHDADLGIRFNARTVSPNEIPDGSVQLFLNGENRTGFLQIEGDPEDRMVAFDGLETNLRYSARVVVSDDADRTTTLDWEFDTFDSVGAVVVEAEDYNYSDGVCLDGEITDPPTAGGLFQDHPPPSGYDTNGLPVNGDGIGYLDRVGLAGVDYFQPDGSEPAENEYRPCDPFDIVAVTNDFLRNKYVEAGVSDYALTRTGTGAWLNYTRTFPDADYQVHLRTVSPDGGVLALDLVEVESGGGQTLVSLGRFLLPDSPGLPGYSALVDGEDDPVVLSLNDVQTLRLTVVEGDGDAGLNFLVFVPVPRIATPLVTDLHPANNATNAAPDTTVSLRIENRDTSLAASSLILILDEADVTPDVVLEPDSGGTTVTYQPPELLLPGSTHVARIEFQDDASPPNVISRTWSFVIADLPVLPALFAAPSDTVLNSGFRGRIHKARNDAPAEIFVGANNSSNTAARAELQLAGMLIDPDTGEPFVNEAAGPMGEGSFTLGDTVNFQQDGTSGGLFGGDMPFPNVPPGDPDFMAMEILTYLDLDPGVHRFGVAARDGFRLTSGPRPNEPDLLIARSDAEPSETALPLEAEFEFVVTEAGFYPFRLLWWEGQGDAELEWYSVNRSSGERMLINQSIPTAIAAWQIRVVPAEIAVTQPADTALFAPPADISIAVDAFENDEPPSAVALLIDDQPLATLTDTPFRFDWTGVPGGAYTIAAVMTNLAGESITSAPVRILVDAPPFISAIEDQTMLENTVLAGLPFTIGDIETSADQLELAAASSNAELIPASSIQFDGSGSDRTVSLAPAENQYGESLITLAVSDGLTNTTTSFLLTVTPANFPPELDPVDDVEIDEMQALAVTFTATDIDDPPQELVFSLDATPPAGAEIDPETGEFTWAPTEAQGPSTNLITARVTDNGAPVRSAAQSFRVVVREVNEPPVLAAIEDRVATTGSTLEVQLSASDPDLPANVLTYSFGTNAPADAVLDPATGRFTWTISGDEPIGTNVVHVLVMDDGAPPLTDEAAFAVSVFPAIQLEPLLISENQLNLTWNTSPGFTYRVEFKSDLAKPDWNILGPDIAADGDTATVIDTTTSAAQKYYRVILLP